MVRWFGVFNPVIFVVCNLELFKVRLLRRRSIGNVLFSSL